MEEAVSRQWIDQGWGYRRSCRQRWGLSDGRQMRSFRSFFALLLQHDPASTAERDTQGRETSPSRSITKDFFANNTRPMPLPPSFLQPLYLQSPQHTSLQSHVHDPNSVKPCLNRNRIIHPSQYFSLLATTFCINTFSPFITEGIFCMVREQLLRYLM